MRSSRISLGGLAAVSMIAALGSGLHVADRSSGHELRNVTSTQQASERSTPPASGFARTLQSLMGGSLNGNSRGRNRRAGPGWSNRHVKRMALKARNVKRSRRQGRG